MTETYTSQPDETSGVDVCMLSDAADTNEDAADLAVGEYNNLARISRTLIKFNLSTIPSNALLISATLSLKVSVDRSDNARDFKVYRVLRAWVEAQATWNSYSTGNAWTTAGCGSNGNDADLTTVWSTCSFTATEAVGTQKDFVFSATGLAELQKMVSGIYTNNGWLIKADTESADAYQFYASNNATSTNRPKLVVTYALSPGSIMF